VAQSFFAADVLSRAVESANDVTNNKFERYASCSQTEFVSPSDEQYNTAQRQFLSAQRHKHKTGDTVFFGMFFFFILHF
jgi:hypothetical protein